MACKDCIHFEMCNRTDMKNCPHFKDRSQFVEVAHGIWMLESDGMGQWGGYTRYCNHCNDFFTTDAEAMYFCPNCGAKMIGIEQAERSGMKYELVDGEWKTVWGVTRKRFVEMRDEDDFPKFNNDEPEQVSS